MEGNRRVIKTFDKIREAVEMSEPFFLKKKDTTGHFLNLHETKGMSRTGAF